MYNAELTNNHHTAPPNHTSRRLKLTFEAIVDLVSPEVVEPSFLHHYWAPGERMITIGKCIWTYVHHHHSCVSHPHQNMNECVISHLTISWVSLLYWVGLGWFHSPPPTLLCEEASICKRRTTSLGLTSVLSLILKQLQQNILTDRLWCLCYFKNKS